MCYVSSLLVYYVPRRYSRLDHYMRWVWLQNSDSIEVYKKHRVVERGIELEENSTYERIHVLIGSGYISEILGERNIRIRKRSIAVDSTFGYLIQGKEDEVNCKDIFANHLIVKNEEFNFDRVRNLWSLETIGTNPDNEVPMSDKEILKSFEQNTVYTNKRYETRLLWKEDSRQLKSNYEIAKRRLLGLSKTFEKNEEL
ncbi:integrase catalytic domain-containing protein [Trichonephila clavipes]|nr:integrase catalytic domain-containing protein [Trichonephila clavipes]